jgi:TRAP transporter TAXI family solute receptor
MLKRVLAGCVVVAAIALAGHSAWAQKDIKWGTSQVGSAGHKAQVLLADVLNREMPKYRISVLPTAGAVPTVKGYAVGEFDAFYGSDISFNEFGQDTGRFKGFKAQMKRTPVQSFWAYTIDPGLGIRLSDKDKIKKWGDLTGKRVYTGPLVFDNRLHLERALAAVGVKHQYVQVDLSTVGSQLASGALDAIIIYTSAQSTPVPWLAEASLAVDWMALNPSAEERATLKSKNFALVDLPASVFKRDTHTPTVTVTPLYFGFHPGMDIPADDVYQMLKILEAKAPEMAKADESFSQVAKDFAGMQKLGVESSVEYVPVHPGLAKYMKEKGVWNAAWDGKIAKN